MERRAFLRSVFSAVAAGAVLDVDQLLWVPGAKTIFLPTVEPVPFFTPDWVTGETLAMLRNQLVFRFYEWRLDAGTVRVPLPQRFA